MSRFEGVNLKRLADLAEEMADAQEEVTAAQDAIDAVDERYAAAEKSLQKAEKQLLDFLYGRPVQELQHSAQRFPCACKDCR